MKVPDQYSKELTEHFFRSEYGRIVSVLTKYVGTDHVETAEDLAQEALVRAYDSWQHNGIPENPRAWLYKTAQNLALNSLKHEKYLSKYQATVQTEYSTQPEGPDFSEEHIQDEQLKMMFACCHPAISQNSQIALILKILCGLSITEIANAFFSTGETINKRLVRGRKQLREQRTFWTKPDYSEDTIAVVLRTIYLLFNEGYSPSQKDTRVRHDLCVEAIRLAKLLVSSKRVVDKSESYGLLALMYLNAARFEARTNDENEIADLRTQDRTCWNNTFISRGTLYLEKAIGNNSRSKFLILAAISANHCIAPSFNETNWSEILTLYDSLLAIEDSPIARLNRAVALAKARSNSAAISELLRLEANSDIAEYYLFHATLADLFHEERDQKKAVLSYQKAIKLAENERDKKLLQKKLMNVVPIL